MRTFAGDTLVLIINDEEISSAEDPMRKRVNKLISKLYMDF